MRTIAAIPAVGLLAGATLGFLLSDLVEWPGHALLLGGAVASLWACRAARPRLVAVAVAVAFAAGGSRLAADAWRQAWRPSLRIAFEELARGERDRAALERRVVPEDDEAFATVTGVLRADAAATLSGVSLSVAVDGITGRDGRAVRGGLLVTVVGSLAFSSVDEWRAGRRVRMPVQLHRPSRYLDPGVPDNERMLARSGTTLVGTVKSGALVEITSKGRWWSEYAGGARLFARRAFERFVGRWSPQSAAIVTAIVIGDRAGLDADVERRLQDAGTYHVIAISGGNIAILAGLLMAACRFAGCLGRGAMLTAIGVLIAHAALVEGGASVDRATLMAIVYFGARAFDLRSPPLNALWTVAAVLVAADPLSIADPAFVLTFGATLGILAVAETTRSRSARSACSPLPFALRRMFLASVAAEAMLFPVGALVFSRVTFAGLALNFLAIPLMAVAQLAGMVVVPLAMTSTRLATVAGWAAHISASGLVWSADLVRFVPALTYRLAPPGWGAVLLYYTSMFTCWVLWRLRCTASGSAEPRMRARVRRTALVAAVAAAAWILVQPAALLAVRGDGRLHVTFLDVGQGDSALVRFPLGSTMLVDAGGLTGSPSFDIGERVVAPVLRADDIRRLDYVVLTHGDPDHIGGVRAIVREFRPRGVWEGIPVPRFDPLTALRLEAQTSGARWAHVYRGDRFIVDGVEISALNPAMADWERQDVRNDDSIVLDVRWRVVSVLLTGDIGREVEREIRDRISPSPLRVLKVAHHGSLTSSSGEFLQSIRPQVAVVSAGRANHFGHPAPAVLQRYRDIGAAIFRTDQDGAVMLDTDGYSIDVYTFTGRHLALSATTANHEGTKNTKDTKR